MRDFTRKGGRRLPRRLASGSVLLQYRALTVVEARCLSLVWILTNRLNLFCLLALGHAGTNWRECARLAVSLWCASASFQPRALAHSPHKLTASLIGGGGAGRNRSSSNRRAGGAQGRGAAGKRPEEQRMRQRMRFPPKKKFAPRRGNFSEAEAKLIMTLMIRRVIMMVGHGWSRSRTHRSTGRAKAGELERREHTDRSEPETRSTTQAGNSTLHPHAPMRTHQHPIFFCIT